MKNIPGGMTEKTNLLPCLGREKVLVVMFHLYWDQIHIAYTFFEKYNVIIFWIEKDIAIINNWTRQNKRNMT